MLGSQTGPALPREEPRGLPGIRGISSPLDDGSRPDRTETRSPGAQSVPGARPFPTEIAPAPTARSVGVEPVLKVRTTARVLRIDLRDGPVVGVEHPDASFPDGDARGRSFRGGMVPRSSPVLGSGLTPALPPATATASLLPSRTSRTDDRTAAAARRRAPTRTSSPAWRRAGLGPQDGHPRRRREFRSCSRIWRSSRCSSRSAPVRVPPRAPGGPSW